MKTDLKPKFRANDMLTQELVGETLVYDLKRNKAFCLNNTSAIILKLCDGTRAIGEITNTLSKQTKTLVSKDLVLLAIDQFNSDDLLENTTVPESAFGGMSRREVIRKVGLASVIALPIVSAIVVPSAANAQSCLAPGSPCIQGAPSACCDSCDDFGSASPGNPGICIQPV